MREWLLWHYINFFILDNIKLHQIVAETDQYALASIQREAVGIYFINMALNCIYLQNLNGLVLKLKEYTGKHDVKWGKGFAEYVVFQLNSTGIFIPWAKNFLYDTLYLSEKR